MGLKKIKLLNQVLLGCKMYRRAFTLVEIMVAVVVFALVMIGAGGIFLTVQQSWQSQKGIVDSLRNAHWAVEFLCAEIRHTTTTASPGWARVQIQSGGERLRFGKDTDANNSPDTTVWYWRGNGGILGDSDKIYRGTGTSLLGPSGANANREELVNFIVDNTDGNPIFSESTGIVTIEITTSVNNKSYTLRSQARVRN